MPMSWIARGAASAERGRRLMQLRGVTPNGHPLWTPWEIGPVVELTPAYGLIFPMVERRTRPAVYSKARRLGVAPKAPPRWTENEILRLRKFYPTRSKEQVLAAFPGRSYTAVAKAASARGIYRSKGVPASTGIPLLDQVLERAARHNMSLAELDSVARTGNYFRRRRWRTKPDTYLHCVAARSLGGKLRARFS